MANVMIRKGQVIQDPPLVQWLFNNRLAAWLWLLPRLWLGYQWLQSGLEKLANPQWTQSGQALQNFWLSAVKTPQGGRAPITFDWYRSFIQALLNAHTYTWFSKLVVAGELLIGVALILGAFTGIAAFLGGFMNWNFMMAGSASVNPMFFVISVGLILAWKVSGYIGADYLLLSWIGTPWRGAPVSAGQPSLEQKRGMSPVSGPAPAGK